MNAAACEFPKVQQKEQESQKNLQKIQEMLNVNDLSQLELIPYDEDNISESEDTDMTPGGDYMRSRYVQKFIYVFKPLRVLGSGGFGIVLACKEKKTHRKIALKIAILDRENPSQAAKSISREVEMLSKLSHPNLIKIYQHTQQYKNVALMEMELGLETVQQFAQKRRDRDRRPLSEEEVASIMKGVFQGLSYLHDEKNVIHRDIKPENILIGDYKDLSRIKLIDFGLAVEYTKDNILDFAKCGTMLYTPPEQAAKNFAYAKVSNINV